MEKVENIQECIFYFGKSKRKVHRTILKGLRKPQIKYIHNIYIYTKNMSV